MDGEDTGGSEPEYFMSSESSEEVFANKGGGTDIAQEVPLGENASTVVSVEKVNRVIASLVAGNEEVLTARAAQAAVPAII